MPEEDALRARPFGGEGLRGLEDLGGVREETSVPEVGASAFEDVDEVGCARGRRVGVRALEVEG